MLEGVCLKKSARTGLKEEEEDAEGKREERREKREERREKREERREKRERVCVLLADHYARVPSRHISHSNSGSACGPHSLHTLDRPVL